MSEPQSGRVRWQSLDLSESLKPWLLVAAVVALIAAVVPPLASASGRYVAAEAGQFCLLAIVVPVLTVLGAPWRLLGLDSLAQRAQLRRVERRRLRDAIAFVLPALVVMVIWRTAPIVDRLARDRWLLALEVLTLVPAGCVIWIELVPSGPFTPRLAPHLRIAVVAVTMWTIWVCAYFVGLSNTVTYRAYLGEAHRALDIQTDQQIAAGLMWVVGAVVFMPFAFLALMSWLRREEAPSSGGSAAPGAL